MKGLARFLGRQAMHAAGAMVFTRYLIQNWVRDDFIVNALGIVAILTGLLHLLGRMRVNRHQRQ